MPPVVDVATLTPEARRQMLASVIQEMARRMVVIPALEPVLDPPLGSVRYRVMYGGRGGAKSWSIARKLLKLGTERRLRVLCAREYQTSIRDSVHKLLSDQIITLGLQQHYTVTLTSIIGANGTEFIFKGIRRNINEIKSMEGIDVVWIEEAQSVREESWKVITPTIRKEGSEIWVSFNPGLPSDPTYTRLVINTPARTLIKKVLWHHNPWLSRVVVDEQAEMAQKDPEGHAHVWGGEPWARSDTQVLNGKWVVEEFEPLKKWDGPYYGADWGFANDPTILVRFWRADRKLWIEYETGGVGWSYDDIERAWREIPGAREHLIRADEARPETIAALGERGWRTEGAEKWPGSVKDGITHLRSYDQIVIHPRCTRATTEARLWRYKTNDAGDVLPKLVEGNDHIWDSVRYGLGPLIQKSGPHFYVSTG